MDIFSITFYGFFTSLRDSAVMSEGKTGRVGKGTEGKTGAGCGLWAGGQEEMLIRAVAVSVSVSDPRVEAPRPSAFTSALSLLSRHTNSRHNYSWPGNTSTLTRG